MNNRKKLFKKRFKKVKLYRQMRQYLNNEMERHQIFNIHPRETILIDRIITNKYFLIVKAHYANTKTQIKLEFSGRRARAKVGESTQ